MIDLFGLKKQTEQDAPEGETPAPAPEATRGSHRLWAFLLILDSLFVIVFGGAVAAKLYQYWKAPSAAVAVRRPTKEPAKAPAPPPLQRASQAPVVKLEKAIKEAAQEEVSRAAETVTAEEVQASPGVASVVTSKSLKSGKEVDKSKSVETASDTEEAEEDQEVASLIEPGNSPKATAYVRAGDLITGGSSDPDLDDYMLAL